jgi:hypothetical protein
MPASATRLAPCVNQEKRLNWAEQFRLAMQQGDSAVIRKMADEAQRDEARMCLTLLADLVDSRKWRVLLAAWMRMLPAKSRS